MRRAFSTIELMIAMALLALTMGGVVLLAFSNQSVLVDSQIASEALAKTQEMIEESQTLARKDFKLVNPIGATVDGIYTKTLAVEAQPDWFSKKITATVTWTGEHFRNQRTSLSTIVSNFENPVGADTCSSVLTGDWTDPDIKNGTTDFATLAADAGNQYDVADVDASIDSSALTNRDRLYVGVSGTSGNPAAKTFFTFDITNPANPTLIANKSIDTDSSSVEGVTAIQVAGRYAFAASARSANFNTVSPDVPCDNTSGANRSCGQLHVIDLGVTPAQVIYTLQVASVVGMGGQGIGSSLAYKDGYLYLGLAKTGSGPEFNVIDVHNPTSPFWLSGLDVGSQVNSITVRTTVDGTFAYIATPNGTLGGGADEVSVINVSNPASPSYVSGFAGFDNSANGKSLYAVGDHLYAGETVSAGNPELYRFDNTAPLSFAAKNPNPFTYNAATRPNAFSQEVGASVNGLVVRDYLAFLATGPTGQLLTYDISDPANVTQYASPVSFSGAAAALDCEGNYLYAASNSTSPNRGHLYVIAP